jgi:REP element-mobilizing transposase RayT
MRLPRRTYDGAFHHGMNRGYEGRPIFRFEEDKRAFLELLEKVQALSRVRVLAYCVMDTHYHMVLQNDSGRMPDFFKQLNGRYARHYRKRHGGRGYVFQDRYKSMLIQDDAYLMVAIGYVLQNPVSAGLVRSYSDYPWSSGRFYYGREECAGVDRGYVEDLFGSQAQMRRFMAGTGLDALPTVRSALGPVIGGEGAVSWIEALAERRSGRESLERRRSRDRYFEPVGKVFQEFEKRYGVRIEELDLRTYPGKRLRAEFLAWLRERAGLTYREIARLDPFSNLDLNSLGGLYRQARAGKAGRRE